MFGTMVGPVLIVPEEDVAELLIVEDVLDIETAIFPWENSVSPLGPPQISEELPLQVIPQRPSVAGTLPAERAFPQ
jgi:hypothetical protein